MRTKTGLPSHHTSHFPSLGLRLPLSNGEVEITGFLTCPQPPRGPLEKVGEEVGHGQVKFGLPNPNTHFKKNKSTFYIICLVPPLVSCEVMSKPVPPFPHL